jgi:hypothetical protein
MLYNLTGEALQEVEIWNYRELQYEEHFCDIMQNKIKPKPCYNGINESENSPYF